VRILVATDSIGAMSSRKAGEVIAAGWRPDAEVAVLPIGEAGAGFVAAYADLTGIPTSTQVIDGRTVTTGTGTTGSGSSTAVVRVQGSDQGSQGAGIPYQQSSRSTGEAVAAVVRSEPLDRILVDLTGLWVHDAGAGMLAALGAVGDRPLDQGVAGLSGLSQLDLAPARALLEKTELIGVIPAAQLDRPLLGLRGITAVTGREAGVEADLMLSTDAALEAFAELASPTNAAAHGAGACGGLGFAVLALGGRLTTGPALALGSPQGQAALRQVDLVATGCSVFGFASRGGGVVAAMAEVASAVLSPCIVIAGEVVIGSREMRTMGVEAAYAVRESVLDDPRGDVSEAELSATARRVARSWTW
jgi:glycerate kinase